MILTEFLVVLYADHVRFHPRHPYIESPPIVQVEKSFLQNERGYRDGLKHQKGRNKGSLYSKVAQSYMTPSLYLCSIFNFAYKQ